LSVDRDTEQELMQEHDKCRIGCEPDKYAQNIPFYVRYSIKGPVVAPAFHRDPVYHSVDQKRSKEDNGIQLSIGQQVPHGPHFDGDQHGMFQASFHMSRRKLRDGYKYQCGKHQNQIKSLSPSRNRIDNRCGPHGTVADENQNESGEGNN